MLKTFHGFRFWASGIVFRVLGFRFCVSGVPWEKTVSGSGRLHDMSMHGQMTQWNQMMSLPAFQPSCVRALDLSLKSVCESCSLFDLTRL